MKILYSRTSLKYLQRLEGKAAQRIIQAIDRLPSQGNVKKLKGKKLKNVFRLRTGGYRIIFVIEEDFIKIVKIDTRGDVYK